MVLKSNTDEDFNKSLKCALDLIKTNKTIADAHKRKIIKIVDSEVFNEKEESLAVSKAEFASKVLENKAPYENICIDGFEPIFENIEKILTMA